MNSASKSGPPIPEDCKHTHRRMHTRITTTKHDWPQCWCRWQGVSSACWEQMAGQMHAWIWPWCPQMIEQHSRPHFTLSLPVLLLLCSLVPLFAYGNFFFFYFEPYGAITKAVLLGTVIFLQRGCILNTSMSEHHCVTGHQRKPVLCMREQQTERGL